MTPVAALTAASTSPALLAIRSPAVPTATIATASSRFASSTIPVIAVTVRSIAAGAIAPVSWIPSPRRLTSARSATGRKPAPSRSATWNFTEFVPTSITA